jgi:hypothetical protein
MPPMTAPSTAVISDHGGHGGDPECLWYARRLLAESEHVLNGVRLDPSLPPPG